MPYIDDDKRAALEFEGSLPITPGDLNYAISSLVHRYVKAKGLSYASLNEAVGVLECAKFELYRTVVAPYENEKRFEHGAVSELDTMCDGAIPGKEEPAVVDTAALLTQLKAVLDQAQAAPVAVAPRRRRTAAAKAQTPAQPAPESPPSRSSVRRPAQVIGEDPGNADAPNDGPTEASEAPRARPQGAPQGNPKGVDKHVADVWEQAARGNGEDDDF